jgi:hypothetical protein
MAGVSARRTACMEGEAEVLRAATGPGTAGARRGTGPSPSTQIEETTSGRASSQQGHAATCTDSPPTPSCGGGERGGGRAQESVVAMRAREHRSRSWEHDPRRGHSRRRRRGSRDREGHLGDPLRASGLEDDGPRSPWRAAEPTMHVRGVCARAHTRPRAWAGSAAIRPRQHWLPTGRGTADRSGMRGGLAET